MYFLSVCLRKVSMRASTIVIAGGSGFIGQYLGKYFSDLGYKIVILTRNSGKNTQHIKYVQWDGKAPGAWQANLDGALAVINLAGKSVNCRYTASNRREILESRIESTQAIGKAILASRVPPKIWLNSSTATIYPHSEGKSMVEEDQVEATNFSERVAKAWENSFYSFDLPETRQIAMRIAIVLGNGSALSPLMKLCKWGLGGTQGSGKQYVSWLHIHDLARMMEFFINNIHTSGTYNCSSPHPLSNAAFMATLRKVMNISFGLPANRWMLEVGAFFMQTETELILKSRKVVPQRLEKEGFDLSFPILKNALEDIIYA